MYESKLGKRLARIVAWLVVMKLCTVTYALADDADRIRPYSGNPYYWQYKGQPVLLLGGTGQDNLFNHPNGLEPGDTLEAHLDLLVSVGGNYVRNTMSTREAGNLFAFHRDDRTGLFDLDRFDFANYDVYEMGGWGRNPFNPKNNVKVYGGQRHGGGLEEGTHKFWRNILGGCASSRFHRQGPSPGVYGAGLGELAQKNIRSLRMLTDAMNVFVCEPLNNLLGDRQPNEAYCLAEPGRQYAVYFPDGGAVKLDISAAEAKLQVRWLDISRSAWQDPQTVDGGGTLELRTPGEGSWAVLVLAEGAASRLEPRIQNQHQTQRSSAPIQHDARTVRVSYIRRL